MAAYPQTAPTVAPGRIHLAQAIGRLRNSQPAYPPTVGFYNELSWLVQLILFAANGTRASEYCDLPVEWFVSTSWWVFLLTISHSNRVSSNQSLRCRETEFSGQRQRGRNGFEGSRTPLQRQNLAKQPRQFGANRREPGNLR